MEKEDKNQQLETKKTSSDNSLNKNLEIAQALNQEELNNLSNSPNLESLSPDETLEEGQGAPTESIQSSNEQLNPESQDIQVINAEDLEGFSDNASPQEGLSDDITGENLPEDNITPENLPIEGSPSQGFADPQIQFSEESNEQPLAPEASVQTGQPVSDESQGITENNNQIEEQESLIGPEETIVNARPIESLPESLEDQETNLAQEGPLETISEDGAPLQTTVQTAEVREEEEQESLSEDIAELAPEETTIKGNPPEVFGEGKQIDVADIIEGPTEEGSAGNPLEEETQLENNIQLAEASETEQLELADEISNGNPQEGISEVDINQIEDDAIPPEETVLAGNPLQGESFQDSGDQQIELAEIPPRGPIEEGVQDYINEVAESVLEKNLEEGLPPQEAVIAALKAGKEAAKEVSSNSEEMNDLAFNLGESLIEDINNKIENIQETIKET